MSTIKDGDIVLLILSPKKRWLLKVNKGGEHHTHRGIIKFDEIIGKPFGSRVTSSMGVEIEVHKPLLSDIVLKMRRSTQIIYPKDVGLILAFTGIKSGSRVAEAGIGSGGLTLFLANAVLPDGKIFGYDIRDESIEATVNNLERFGLSQYVEVKKHDVCEGFKENNLDAVILDLATPWSVIPKAYDALSGSGVLVSYSPQKAVKAMEESKFSDIRTLECLTREILVREGKTRPTTFMVGHTGYITFARKSL
ncbi:MAG: tRNA (adenine-N1)-methyltransferase [Candidatus Odinarchaeia archaeon]